MSKGQDDGREDGDAVPIGDPLTEVDLTRLPAIRDYVAANPASSSAELAAALRAEFSDPSRVWIRSHRPGSVLVVQSHEGIERAGGTPGASLYRVTREQRTDGEGQFHWSLIGPVE